MLKLEHSHPACVLLNNAMWHHNSMARKAKMEGQMEVAWSEMATANQIAVALEYLNRPPQILDRMEGDA